MLFKELIVRHLGPQGALHERGIRLDETQLPPGVTVQHHGHDGDDAHDGHDAHGPVAGDDAHDAHDGDDAHDRDYPHRPIAGDLLLVSVPPGPGLPDHIDTDLPVGATVVLLFEVEVTELPVGRLLAALTVAKLQVVEATVVSGTPTATVAVVATRTDELVVPAPSLAHDLEPGDHTGPLVLQRLLGEHALEGLVQPARDRALLVQVGELQARVAEVTTELEQTRLDRRKHEATLVRDRDAARKEADVARKEAQAARKEAQAERNRMQSLRSSTSFKVASRLARASGVARRIIPRSGPGKSGS